jgi:predicted nucleotidyltransferase
MDRTTGEVSLSRSTIEALVRHGLPELGQEEAADMARVVDVLIRTFRPDRIYAFGSRARGTATWHSDLDLLVVVANAGEFPHRLAQEAYRAVGHHALPLDMLFMGREEFAWRAHVVSSLPATVLREGRLLYAATA